MAKAAEKPQEVPVEATSEVDLTSDEAIRARYEALEERERQLAELEEREAKLRARELAAKPVGEGEMKTVEISRDVIHTRDKYDGRYDLVVEEMHLPQLKGKGHLVRTKGVPNTEPSRS